MKPTIRKTIIDVFLLAIVAFLVWDLSEAVAGYADYFRYAFGGLILVAGVFVTRDVSRIIASGSGPTSARRPPS